MNHTAVTIAIGKMRKKFRKLLEPVRIGKASIKNRMAMAPMGILILVNPDGSVSQRSIDYYVERAKGGVGLIITSLFKVENEIERIDAIYEPLVTPMAQFSLGELAESVHYYGTKIFIQLTAGFGRVIGGILIDDGVKPVSASDIPAYWRPHVTARGLTTEEVQRLIEDFGRAAEIVAKAGIDGIELHGHEGYLFDQFTTTLWNKRTDQYGGSLENRLRFPTEVLNIIKKKLGKDFPVVYRFGLKDYIKGHWSGALDKTGYVEAGRDIAEGLKMAQLLEKAGFDALHVDAGCYDSWYWAHPPVYQPYACMVDMAAEAKRVVKIPVIAVGKLGIPELAEKVLEEGKADIIAMGRTLLADPYWPMKVQEGRLEEIRPCLWCHEGCLGRMLEKPLSCAVNPATGREKLYQLLPAEKPKKILIAGGGVAGMEAARISASRGHKVTLYEKMGKLGGHLVGASVPEFKQDIGKLVDWYGRELKKLRVQIRLKTEATQELVKRQKPDAVIIATGSRSIIPEIPGIKKPIVATCIDLLLKKKKAGREVVVVGGRLVGCETALWLSRQGKKVTIVEMLPEIASGVHHGQKIMLLALLDQNNVKILTDTSLEEVTDEGVVMVDRQSKKNTLTCDRVALALIPEKALYHSLVDEISKLYEIGDCRDPRKILHAIWDGNAIGREI